MRVEIVWMRLSKAGVLISLYLFQVICRKARNMFTSTPRRFYEFVIALKVIDLSNHVMNSSATYQGKCHLLEYND